MWWIMFFMMMKYVTSSLSSILLTVLWLGVWSLFFFLCQWQFFFMLLINRMFRKSWGMDCEVCFCVESTLASISIFVRTQIFSYFNFYEYMFLVYNVYVCHGELEHAHTHFNSFRIQILGFLSCYARVFSTLKAATLEKLWDGATKRQKPILHLLNFSQPSPSLVCE